MSGKQHQSSDGDRNTTSNVLDSHMRVSTARFCTPSMYASFNSVCPEDALPAPAPDVLPSLPANRLRKAQRSTSV